MVEPKVTEGTSLHGRVAISPYVRPATSETHLFQVCRRDQLAQVGQTVVHAISTALLDYAVGSGILKRNMTVNVLPKA